MRIHWLCEPTTYLLTIINEEQATRPSMRNGELQWLLPVRRGVVLRSIAVRFFPTLFPAMTVSAHSIGPADDVLVNVGSIGLSNNLIRRARKRRDALLCSSRTSLQQGQALSHIPLRRLHDRLAHQGQTSPFSGHEGPSRTVSISKTRIKKIRCLRRYKRYGQYVVLMYICENVSDRAWYSVCV